MKSAIFFHYPYVRSRVHKVERILSKFYIQVGQIRGREGKVDR